MCFAVQVLQLMQKVLGPEHPNTLTVMNNLAETLGVLGKHAQALSMQQQVGIVMHLPIGPPVLGTLQKVCMPGFWPRGSVLQVHNRSNVTTSPFMSCAHWYRLIVA